MSIGRKNPLVIRRGFAGFQDLLSPEEVAGLACDESVESRRVFKQEGQWQAEFGPFECYDHLGDKDWTLIVQALNNWLPAANDLIKCFDFIPRWRLDDLMVSYGTPGGGVGPHIDLYDVFICQGSGSRRWRVGDLGPHKEFAAHPALLHTEAFDPIIDIELKTGDILYLPPGFPHDGISLENSMSFSVGFRTDSARDMHSALADYMIDKALAAHQVSDPDRTLATHPGKIDKSDFKRIKHHLLDTLDDSLISQFAGTYLTQSKCELDLPEEELEFTSSFMIETLQKQDLIRLGGLRCLYFEDSVAKGIIYINGEQFSLPAELAPEVTMLCDSYALSYKMLAEALDNSAFVEQLTQWLNRGYWYFDAE